MFCLKLVAILCFYMFYKEVMTMAVVHFNMLVELNELLKQKGIDYRLHAVGGCTCGGIELKCLGEKYPAEDIVHIINEYLSGTWTKVKSRDDDPYILDIYGGMDIYKI